jgi:glycosyltransferase involved in cell wall biosynthesis
MNLKDRAISKDMNLPKNSIVINQTPKGGLFEDKTVDEIRVITIDDSGLSKSRNLAISKSTSDICYISDDDLLFQSDFVNTVEKYHRLYKKYDVICFKVPTLNLQRQKKYFNKIVKMGYIRSLKVSSYEISFKRESVVNKNIEFDPIFGAGSKRFSMGEENIFLYDCLKNGLKVLYVPECVAVVNHAESTWFRGYNEKYLHDLGAVYYRMSKHFWWLLAFQYVVRKRKIIQIKGLVRKLKIMRKGLLNYKRNNHEEK